MDGRQPDYPHSDPTSAAQYPPGHEYNKSSHFSTPESSYGPPSTARSGSFPDYVQRSYADSTPTRYPQSAPSGHAAMAQTSSPSSHSMPNGLPPRGHAPGSVRSDQHLTIDPSIAQSSPSYPPPHNYSPYPPQHEMQYGQPMPSYGRPEWAGQYQQPMGYGHPPATSGGPAPGLVGHAMPRPPAGGHPLSTVYSFVPIPGAQQHKRPRRRYEEIERMYKCGWNGCEKAYGTLNHLNAHVTMQSHGTKRTPEEFKEIRKEWKAKKKEEENQRKAEEERQRQDAVRSGHDTSQAPPAGQYGQQHMMPPQMGGPQLPPIGYQPAGGQAPGQYGPPQHVDGAPQYGYGNQYPQSPYAQGGLPYQQPHDQPPNSGYPPQ